MRNLIIFSFVSIFFLTAFSPTSKPVTAQSIVGDWYTPKKESVVTIYEEDGKYHGKITWLKDPTDDNGEPLKDIRNVRKALRDREIMEMDILMNLKFKRPGKWTGGKVYSPIKGRKYNCFLKLKNENTLAVRGYKGSTYFGKTFIWKRK